ncbi:hypothetical protein GIB67_016497 [Kingdonia uniflora]|uniref:RING-type E3 ubiquitin transferase n=1 Tax=Kingdonia uniflora TaxID=39325 RepID=A0A7J7M812_9MAGN|nr:hypothetical protein GIB67_016497 [Kingdonia uniflora]
MPSSFLMKNMDNCSRKIHHFFIHVICFSLLLPCVHSDEGSSSKKTPAYYKLFIIAFAFVFFLVAFFTICTRRTQSHQVSVGGITPLAIWQPEGAAEGRVGLEPSLIEIFPTFLYSVVRVLNMGNGVQECAVCLNHFEDDEIVRVLPRCDHGFHLVCIDAWLASHDTCPVCRDNLVPVPVPKPSDPLWTQVPISRSRLAGGNRTSEMNDSEVWIQVIDDQNSDLIRIQNHASQRFPQSQSQSIDHLVARPGENTEEEVRK